MDPFIPRWARWDPTAPQSRWRGLFWMSLLVTGIVLFFASLVSILFR
jgi:hypothetical protein